MKKFGSLLILSGFTLIAQAANFTVTPTSPFPTSAIPGEAISATYQVTNNTSSTIVAGDLSVSGAALSNAADFTVVNSQSQPNTCLDAVAPDGNCSFTVSLKPESLGTVNYNKKVALLFDGAYPYFSAMGADTTVGALQFARIAPGLTGTQASAVLSYTVGGAHTLLAGAGGGHLILRSNDDGNTFSEPLKAAGEVHNFLRINSGSAAGLYAASNVDDDDFVLPVEHAGLYKSTDEGETWTVVSDDNHNLRNVINVRAYTNNNTPGILVFAPHQAFFSTDGSDNSFQTFAPAYPAGFTFEKALVTTDNNIFIAGYGDDEVSDLYEYRSTDNSWQPVEVVDSDVTDISQMADGRVVVAAGSSLFVSNTEEIAFTRYANITSENINAVIERHDLANSVFLILSDNSSVYTYTFGDDDVEAIANSAVKNAEMLQYNDGNYYIAAEDGIHVCTTLSPFACQTKTADIPNVNYPGLSSQSANNLVIAGDDVKRSTDGGSSFSDYSQGLPAGISVDSDPLGQSVLKLANGDLLLRLETEDGNEQIWIRTVGSTEWQQFTALPPDTELEAVFAGQGNSFNFIAESDESDEIKLYSVIAPYTSAQQIGPVLSDNEDDEFAGGLADSQGNIYVYGHDDSTDALILWEKLANASSWTNISAGLPSSDSGYIGSLVKDAEGNLYATGIFINGNTTFGGYRRLVGASQFSAMSSLPVSPESVTHAGDLYAATLDGVYVSANDGTNWTRFSAGLPSYNNIVQNLIVSGDDMYISMLQNGLFKATLPTN